MMINGINTENTYGVILADGYRYTPPEVSGTYFKGRRTTFFQMLEAEVGMGKLHMPIVFHGEDLKTVTARKSAFDALVYPKVEIELVDGFMYTSILNKIGEAEYVGKNTIKSTYEFSVLRHTALVESVGNTIDCDFTYPYVACCIKAEVSANAESYQLGPVTFFNVEKGQKLEVDGIDGRILVDGAPGAQFAEWIEFPVLVPGKNTIECKDEVTVRYYPTYM